MEKLYLGIDIGGTKTLIELYRENGEKIGMYKYPTEKDKQKFVELLRQNIVANFPRYHEIAVIVCSIPGLVVGNEIRWVPNIGWQDFDLARELTDYFKVPVWLENDTNLAAVYECQNIPGLCAYYTISTGIGAGICRDNSLVESLLYFEPGHQKYRFAGRMQEFEAFASGKAIVERFGKITTDIHDEDDWKEIAVRFSIGLADTIKTLRVDNIIIGGSAGADIDKFKSYLIDALKLQIPPEIQLPNIYRAKHPHENVAYGCFTYGRLKLNEK